MQSWSTSPFSSETFYVQYSFELNIGKSFSYAEEERVEEELNDLGNQGRELVAVSQCGTENSYLG